MLVPVIFDLAVLAWVSQSAATKPAYEAQELRSDPKFPRLTLTGITAFSG